MANTTWKPGGSNGTTTYYDVIVNGQVVGASIEINKSGSIYTNGDGNPYTSLSAAQTAWEESNL